MESKRTVIKMPRTLSEHLILLMFILTIISSLAIYASDTTLSGAVTQNILRVIVYVCVVLSAIIITIKNTKKAYLPIAILIPLVYVFIIYYNSYTKAGFNALLLLELECFFLLEDVEKKKIYDYFKGYIYLLSLIGIIVYFCSIIGIPLLHTTVPYYDHTSTVYLNYGFTYLSRYGGVTRLCGLFNEPGYLGTMIAFVLCTENMNLKDKKNIIMFIAGCCTLSVAFFLIVALYTIITKVKDPKYIIPLVLLFAFYFFVLPHIHFSNVAVQRLVNRLSFANGALVGDNRSNSVIDGVLADVLSSPEYMLWGYGNGYTSTLTYLGGISTYKSYIINFGLVGFGLIFIPPILEAIRQSRMNRTIVIYIICFVLSIYQRPNIYSLSYFAVLYGGIIYMRDTIENGVEQ